MLSVDDPVQAAYLPTGSAPVTGTFVNLDSVRVGGTAASLADGSFSADVTLAQGLNVVDIVGTDLEGGLHRELRSVLGGTFQAPEGFVDSAIQVHIGPDELGAIAPMLSGILDPTALAGQVTALNPVIDDGSIVANITGIEFDTPVVQVLPGDGALELAITLPNFSIPMEVEAELLFFPVTLDGALTTDEVVVFTRAALSTDGQGGLALELADTDVELVNFQIDIDGLADFIEDLFMDDADAEALLVGELDVLLADMNSLTDGLMSDLDLSMETELLGQILLLDASFSSAGVTPAGLYLGLDLLADVSGTSASGPGHLLQGPPTRVESDQVTLQVADDFMNRFLHEVWAGGAIDIDLPIEAGGLESVLLQLFGGVQGEPGSLSLRSALPPTWIGGQDGSRLQLGAVTMTVETPGGTYGDVVELQMALDARAELAFTPEGAGIVLSNADITLNPIGDTPEIMELRGRIEEVENAMGIGIGMINDLLSFPIEGLADAELPELDLQRDGSNKGMLVQLSLADLDLGALLNPADPSDPDPNDPVDDPNDPNDPNPPAPPAPEPMEVAVPDTATVYDFDGEVDWDSETGWVCRNDDIEATGDDGVWYVDDRGEVEISGTGHTVYALDDSDVILLTPGNTVYADLGATVDDVDGTNTVIWVDPMSFDTSNAPPDGC